MGVVDSPRRPYLTISIVFAAWKAGLFALAAGSQIGPTYDTSSVLLVDPSIDQYGNSPFTVARLLTRLTSWDAIYFVKASQRGYFFEQEWAFGSALPQCISVFVQRKSFWKQSLFHQAILHQGPRSCTNQRQPLKQTSSCQLHYQTTPKASKLSFPTADKRTLCQLTLPTRIETDELKLSCILHLSPGHARTVQPLDLRRLQ